MPDGQTPYASAMDGYVVHDLLPQVRVTVSRLMPDLPPTLNGAVEALWRKACARVVAGGAKALFNGRVFSADTIAPRGIAGHLTEFRRVVAQMEDPAMFEALRVRPLAVCGVIRCVDGVVFGRRHAGAVYQAGMWQLPPAGSVDAHAVGTDGAVRLERQLLDEMREELGLTPGDVGVPRPLCVVEHSGSHVCDLGMALHCRPGAGAIRAAHASRGNEEYPELRIVSLDDLPAFLAREGDAVVPPAPVFLKRAGWL